MRILNLLSGRSLSLKLTGLLFSVAACSMLVTLLVLAIYQIGSVAKAENRRLESLAQILAPNLTASIQFEDNDTAYELIEPLKVQPGIIDVTVFTDNGIEFAKVVVKGRSEVYSNEEMMMVEQPLRMDGEQHGHLVIRADNSLVREHLQFYARFLVIIIAVVLLFGSVSSHLLSLSFTKPIRSLVEIARKVTMSNDYSLRADNSREDELGDLTRCFNSMLDTVEQRDLTLEARVLQRTSELNLANKKLHSQAYNDALSGLSNRRHIHELVACYMDPEGGIQPFSLFFLDLDGFKEVNDTLGHDFGDDLIVAAARRIERVISAEDTLARFGGDEFTVLVKGITEQSILSKMAERIRGELCEPFYIREEMVHITASIGISSYTDSNESAESLMKKADLAMYSAKESGRNRVRFYQPDMLERVQSRRQTLDDLHIAIENQEFELFYQPIVNLSNGKVDKAEALIRWKHPQKGYVMPSEFIPVAEESGLINELGSWVAKQALEAVIAFRQRLSANFSVHFNVSPSQFRKDSSWLDEFEHCLKLSRLDRHALSIEITENVLMTSEGDAIDELMIIKERGVEIAIDDFGVGYSSLSYLQRLAIDTLKIDKTFVQQLGLDAASSVLCRTMLQMAENLGMKVVAEGIETVEQMDMLSRFGCHYGQGYLFSKPLKQRDFEALLLDEMADTAYDISFSTS